MAQKTREQLVTQSNGTFQDSPPANITPENHRQFNDDLIESVANVSDGNVFTQENTFTAKIISNMGGGQTAFESTEGYIVLTNGGIQMTNGPLDMENGGARLVNGSLQLDTGDLNVLAGTTSLGGSLDVTGGANLNNNTFIRKLQNCFATNPITASGTLDLISVDGNVIYIEGDATIDTFNGNIGEIYYATFTGTCLFDASMSGISPSVNFQVYPNDTLIFIFTSTTTIRVLGIRRGGDWVNNVFNGQNYFTIYNPADALLLANNNALDMGAVYRVVQAVELPKLTGNIWDVYLTAKQTNLFEDTCWIKCPTFNGTAQKAWFLGDFEPESILITDRFDSTIQFDYATADINSGSGARFAKDGAQTFVDDSLASGFVGYVHHNIGGKTQSKNILDVLEGNNYFGAIYPQSGQDFFIPNHGNTTEGIYGANFAVLGVPSVATINLAMSGNAITTELLSYNCCYQVVNGVCSVYFTATADGRFNNGSSGREFLLYLPIPFSGQGAAASQYGYGSLRNLTDSNHPDMGLLVTKHSSIYMEISAKWSSAISSVKSCQLSGCFVYPILTHP